MEGNGLAVMSVDYVGDGSGVGDERMMVSDGDSNSDGQSPVCCLL